MIINLVWLYVFHDAFVPYLCPYKAYRLRHLLQPTTFLRNILKHKPVPALGDRFDKIVIITKAFDPKFTESLCLLLLISVLLRGDGLLLLGGYGNR